MTEGGHGFQKKYPAWCEIGTEVVGPEPDIPIASPVHFHPPHEGPPCVYNTTAFEVTDFGSKCVQHAQGKRKRKRNTSKSFRTPLLSTVLYKIARRFLSQPGQDKQNLSIFHD